MHPKDILIKDFSYNLPEEKIAKFPLQKRDQSKLLVYKNRIIREDKYCNIADHLPVSALLIFNNTKVVEARLLFQKPTGGIVEIFVLEPHPQYDDIISAMNKKEKVCWKCLIGGASKWKHGQVLQKHLIDAEDYFTLNAVIVEKLSDSFMIEFTWQPGSMSFADMLRLFGVMPIPPYLKRDTELLDKERYQTIFASHDGSVASPTGGLHFTEKIFRTLKNYNIQSAFVTLHVGAGTFMPVKTETLEGHLMHSELMTVDKTLIEKLILHSQNILAVGTTSFRTLESLYWMGLKCFLKPDISIKDLEIKQWEVYDELGNHTISVNKVLGALLNWMTKRSIQKLVTKTHILIAPPYQAKLIKGLITNFHQPNSTLLLLVASLVGKDWKKVYDYALQNDFRFLSYGDGCILYPH